MAYRFIKENRGKYAVKEMAGLLGLSCGAFYKWFKHGFSRRREKADAELLSLIRKIFDNNHGRYGSPRVHQELRKLGKRASLKKTAKMMRENGLKARSKRKFIPTTDSKHSLPVCENILNRDFSAEKPGQKWVSDITYLRTVSGWIYLTIVLDLFDRKIIGWAFSSSMHTEKTTVAALEMAVKNRTPEKDLIFHSDRGVQYCAQAFRDTLLEHCPLARQSMSHKGNCWDNACAESFFGTLKKEVPETNGKYSVAEARQAVFMYIETYYNRVRIHSALDYVAPNGYDLLNVA